MSEDNLSFNSNILNLYPDYANKNYPLHCAAAAGDLDFLIYIAHYVDLTCLGQMRDTRGATALHMATRENQVECVDWLISNTNLTISDVALSGETPLHIAAARGHTSLLQWLINRSLNSSDLSNMEHKSALLFNTDKLGLSCLHLAALKGHVQIINWIVMEFQLYIGKVMHSGNTTPAHLAASAGHILVLSILLTCSDKCKDWANAIDRNGTSVMYFAAQEGRLDCVRYLHEQLKVDLMSPCPDNMTSLHAAAQQGHYYLIKYYLNHLGRDIIFMKTTFDEIPLHFASVMGHSNIVKLLLDTDDEKITPFLADKNLSTACHDAAYYDHPDCLNLLLEAGGDIYAKNNDGKSVYSLISDRKNNACYRIVEYFIEKQNYVTGTPRTKDGQLKIQCEPDTADSVNIIKYSEESFDALSNSHHSENFSFQANKIMAEEFISLSERFEDSVLVSNDISKSILELNPLATNSITSKEELTSQRLGSRTTRRQLRWILRPSYYVQPEERNFSIVNNNNNNPLSSSNQLTIANEKLLPLKDVYQQKQNNNIISSNIFCDNIYLKENFLYLPSTNNCFPIKKNISPLVNSRMKDFQSEMLSNRPSIQLIKSNQSFEEDNLAINSPNNTVQIPIDLPSMKPIPAVDQPLSQEVAFFYGLEIGNSLSNVTDVSNSESVLSQHTQENSCSSKYITSLAKPNNQTNSTLIATKHDNKIFNYDNFDESVYEQCEDDKNKYLGSDNTSNSNISKLLINTAQVSNQCPMNDNSISSSSSEFNKKLPENVDLNFNKDMAPSFFLIPQSNSAKTTLMNKSSDSRFIMLKKIIKIFQKDKPKFSEDQEFLAFHSIMLQNKHLQKHISQAPYPHIPEFSLDLTNSSDKHSNIYKQGLVNIINQMNCTENIESIVSELNEIDHSVLNKKDFDESLINSPTIEKTIDESTFRIINASSNAFQGVAPLKTAIAVQTEGNPLLHSPSFPENTHENNTSERDRISRNFERIAKSNVSKYRYSKVINPLKTKFPCKNNSFSSGLPKNISSRIAKLTETFRNTSNFQKSDYDSSKIHQYDCHDLIEEKNPIILSQTYDNLSQLNLNSNHVTHSYFSNYSENAKTFQSLEKESQPEHLYSSPFLIPVDSKKGKFDKTDIQVPTWELAKQYLIQLEDKQRSDFVVKSDNDKILFLNSGDYASVNIHDANSHKQNENVSCIDTLIPDLFLGEKIEINALPLNSSSQSELLKNSNLYPTNVEKKLVTNISPTNFQHKQLTKESLIISPIFNGKPSPDMTESSPLINVKCSNNNTSTSQSILSKIHLENVSTNDITTPDSILSKTHFLHSLKASNSTHYCETDKFESFANRNEPYTHIDNIRYPIVKKSDTQIKSNILDYLLDKIIHCIDIDSSELKSKYAKPHESKILDLLINETSTSKFNSVRVQNNKTENSQVFLIPQTNSVSSEIYKPRVSFQGKVNACKQMVSVSIENKFRENICSSNYPEKDVQGLSCSGQVKARVKIFD